MWPKVLHNRKVLTTQARNLNAVYGTLALVAKMNTIFIVLSLAIELAPTIPPKQIIQMDVKEECPPKKI